MIFKFYDTCSLLMKATSLFEKQNENERIVISSITLQELENIKNSNYKDPDIKHAARILLHILGENPHKYTVQNYLSDMIKPIVDKGLEISNDTKILACAFYYDTYIHPDETVFVTNDLALKQFANLFFGEDSIESVIEEEDTYDGYLEVTMDEEEMGQFYSNLNNNRYELYINQYLIVKNPTGEIIDKLCWTGETHRHITYGNLNSVHFGNVKPLKNDIEQALLVDSFYNNPITMVKGRAGTGKTFLSLAFLLHKLEKHEIDKIIVFCNTVATKNSAKLGYYPGTRDEKLLDSQIGNLLSSKFGGKIAVEQMIQQEKLILLPLSDIRGYDTSGMRAGIYISEAQNLDVSLMKLALQRIGEDSICIIDGDCYTQVDSLEYAGANNGMKRVSKIFRGTEVYGEVTLKTTHRSRIAAIAERLC